MLFGVCLASSMVISAPKQCCIDLSLARPICDPWTPRRFGEVAALLARVDELFFLCFEERVGLKTVTALNL